MVKPMLAWVSFPIEKDGWMDEGPLVEPSGGHWGPSYCDVDFLLPSNVVCLKLVLAAALVDARGKSKYPDRLCLSISLLHLNSGSVCLFGQGQCPIGSVLFGQPWTRPGPEFRDKPGGFCEK